MKQNKILLLILIFAFILRFYKLGSNPPSLYWDEASLGYNAFSILKTGKEEFQEFLPLTRFIAFGDYKPVGYIYSIIPFIALFGLNEFSVRLPSALAGVLMVFLTYLLTKKILSKKSALLAASLLAISPWALHLSRGAFEANLAAFLNLLAIFCFLKGLKQKKYLFFSAIFFVLTLYTFNSNRVLTPLLLLGLVIFYFKDLWKIKKWLLLSGFLALILLSPLLPYLRTREARLRFDEVNIFSNLDVIKTSNERIEIDGNTRLAKIFHHRFIGHSFNFLRGFLSFLNPNFLLVAGDINPRLSSQAVGEIYLIELPFLLMGIYYLFKKENKHAKFLCFWLLSALVPAAMAREVPHALRSLSILPVPQIFISFGFINFLAFLKNRAIRVIFSAGCLLILACGFFYYQYFYYFIYPYLYSDQWQYGYKQLVQEVALREEKYNKVVITDHLDRPYIYFLFYQKYSPEKFWKTLERERDWYGFYKVLGFDKYNFLSVEPEDFQDDKETLLVVKPTASIPENFRKLTTIKRLDGQVQFILLERIDEI